MALSIATPVTADVLLGAMESAGKSWTQNNRFVLEYMAMKPVVVVTLSVVFPNGLKFTAPVNEPVT